jgi:hypothetical protein
VADDLETRREVLRSTVRLQRDRLLEAGSDIEAAWKTAWEPARLARTGLSVVALSLTGWALLHRRGWRTAAALWLLGRVRRAWRHRTA